ncbi:hypothetical protein AB0B66_09170 [Catellatospora sp. NPDC049111]|uniref:hypothetical protein n=1 Tax=Catellatospora sp. NPDC049111 TaxID=3155271 RepID=UPI0033D94A44
MAFDAARYEREVIAPLRGLRGGLPDGDPMTRYALTPGMRDAEIEEQLRRVRTFWNQRATVNAATAAAKVCRLLQAADEERKNSAGNRMNTAAYWAEQTAAHQARARAAVAALAQNLQVAYGGVGRVTRVQLAALVATSGLGEREVADALRQAKLRVVDPITLPTDCGLDRTAYKALLDNLAVTGAPTIVHLLHPGITGYRLVGGFVASGGRALDAATVDARIRAAETAADGAAVRAAKAVLGVLRTGLLQGRDLATVALFQVADRMGQLRLDGLPDTMLISTAVDLGLVPEDADLLVSSLPAPTASPTARIRELVADGRLRTAQQQLASVAATATDLDDLRALIARTDAAVADLIEQADQALAAGREEDAERLSGQAAALATDDDAIAARLRGLRPPPPRDLRLRPGRVTTLTWSPPLTGITGLHYRVVRAADWPPASPLDGVLIAETDTTSAEDADASVARRFGYAVFVAGAADVWSRAAEAVVTIIPPVSDVVVRTDRDQAVVSWRTHPAVVAVKVRRTTGRPPSGPADGVEIPAGTASFTDTAIREGTDYYYSIVAVYQDERLHDVRSPEVLVSVAPRRPAAAVEDLAVEPIETVGGFTRLRLSWTPQPSVEVRIRRAERRPAWTCGTELPEAAIGEFGHEVAGVAGSAGERSTLITEVPEGFHVYVPFAIGGTGAVVGRFVAQGLAAPLSQVKVERLGDRVTLSWVWPEAAGLAEVTWTPDTGQRSTFRVTRHQYLAESGCRLDAGPGGGTVSVVAVTVGPLGEARSPARQCVVTGRQGRLSYTVQRLPDLRRRFSRSRVLRVVAETGCQVEHLVLVARHGQVMPLRPDQGTEILRCSALDFTAGQAREFPFELPDGVAKPYWIRCFIVPPHGATIADPPVDQLKV